MGFLHAALDLKGKDRAAATREIFFIQGMVGVVGQTGMVDGFHLGMGSQEINDLFRILRMAFQSQRQGFCTLQQQKCGKGRDAGTGIPQQHCPDIGNKGSRAYSFYKGNTEIAGVGVSNRRVLPRCCPVEFSGVHDDTAQGGAMTADKLGRGVDYDIRTVFNGTNKIRSTKCVIHHQRQTVLMGKLRQFVDIGNIAVRIAQSLNVDRPGVFLNGCLHLVKIVDVHKGSCNSKIRKGMLQQIIAAAVDGLLGNKMAAVLSQSL